MNDEQQRFVDRARASLDASSQQLPPALEGRLRAIRYTALASSRRPERAWLPAMAAAVLVAVVSGVSLFSVPREENVITLARIAVDDGAADFDILTRDAPLELYQNLDFYYWLDQGEGHAG